MSLQSAAGQTGKILDYHAIVPNQIPQARGGDILAPAFGMTVAVWITAYISRMPAVAAPGQATVGGMLAMVLIGGFLTARFSRKGILAALAVGALSGLLDILIVGSMIHDYMLAHREALIPSAALWIGGSVLLNAVVAGLGGLLGHFFPSPRRGQIYWTQVFALVLAAATLPLITAGGLVTAFRAGLAVPDWPQSYGYNMFLFPLSMMQKNEGNFYEHAHRLMGTLVGLTSLTAAIYLTLAKLRLFKKIWNVFGNIIPIGVVAIASWGEIRYPSILWMTLAIISILLSVIMILITAIRLWNEKQNGRIVLLAWCIFAAVCVQGVLGGTRVTEKSVALAITHGVFAQIVFAAMAGLIASAGRNYLTLPRTPNPRASTERILTLLLVASVVLQLILGTVLRHTDSLLILHITVAMLVVALGLTCAIRAWGLHGNERPLVKSGAWIIAIIVLQVTLGVFALVFRAPPGIPESIAGAFLTTAHQANGALLLAMSTVLTIWTWRLLIPGELSEASPIAATI